VSLRNVNRKNLILRTDEH